MPSPVVTATLQAVSLGALSNIFAQTFAAYSKQDLFKLDITDIFRFALFGLLTTPPNFAWQAFLEKQFPSMTSTNAKPTSEKTTPVESREKIEETSQLSIKNTVAKFFLDQTLGCWLNTLIFLLLLGWLKGKGTMEIEYEVRNTYWPMVLSSYRFWPLVSLTNLVLIPVSQRILVGNLAGLVWGIYVNLITAG